MESLKKRVYLCDYQYSSEMESRKATIFKISLFLLGFIAMSVQILMIREALALFNGNELVIGLCLGFWMLLTAAGAFLGSWIRLPGFRASQRRAQTAMSLILIVLILILIALPVIMPWAMVYLKSQWLITGEMAGIFDVGLILLCTLAPFCLISGILFPILAGVLSTYSGKNRIHLAYALDSAGSILGGVLFSLLLFMLMQDSHDKPHKATQKSNLENCIVRSSMEKLQSSIHKILYPGQDVVETRVTPFGKLAITRMEEQYYLYENGNPVALGSDVVRSEESVHYAMLLHPHPEKVLMISGGTGGAINEVFKYSGVQVDYIEINPWIIPLVDQYVPLPRDNRLRIINKDPRIFLIQDNNKYDAVLLNTPDPNSAETNRYYTREFFRLIKDRLNPGGLVSFSIPAAGNYMNESSRMLHSVIFKTIASEFQHVRLFPGNRDYIIASGSDLSHSLWLNMDHKGIKNLYVNPGYIDESLMNARSELIRKEMLSDIRANSDLKPFVYLQTYRQWLDHFKVDYRILPASLIILVMLAFILMKPLDLGLFIGGFTASSLEFILILWFQVLYGIIYQMTGLIFAAFMAGMVAGAIVMPQHLKVITFREFRKIQLYFIFLSLLAVPLMLWIPYNATFLFKVLVIFSLVILTGFLMGALFSMVGPLKKTSANISAGQAFSVDLAGSAIGILLVAVYMVPVLGLPFTGLILAGLNVAAILKGGRQERLTV